MGGRSSNARASGRSILLFVYLSGCAATHSEDIRAAANNPGADPHRPPGVAVDPVLELPRATANAEPVGGLAVLAEPVDPEPARRVVRAFFEAVVSESTFDLERLVDRGAPSRQNAKTRPEPALPWWKRRFDRLDYTALGATVFYRRSEMETHTARDAATPSPNRPLPMVPRGDEVVVRVPIVGQAAEKLFGPELVFRLKKSDTANKSADPPDEARSRSPAGGGGGGGAGPPRLTRLTTLTRPTGVVPYKIAELFEDFRLP